MIKIATALLSTALVSSISLSSNADSLRSYLPSEKALKGILACQSLAKSNNWNMAVVIIDRGENIKASFRMDEALPSAYKGAMLKAMTALSWSMSTERVGEFTEQNPQFKQFPGLLTIGGGEPIFSMDGKLIGAVGVAGSYVEHDQKCAKAVLSAIR